MVLYDYECKECGNVFEAFAEVAKREEVDCDRCGSRATLILTKLNKDWFEAFVTEDFDGTPVEVRSRAHYKALCKQHGVYAPHVFGMGWNISEL